MTQTREFTGRFAKLANKWQVVVNTGTPQIGDSVRVRMADKSVKVMIVTGLDGTFGGKVCCNATEKRTESRETIMSATSFRPSEASFSPMTSRQRSHFLQGHGEGKRSEREIALGIGF